MNKLALSLVAVTTLGALTGCSSEKELDPARFQTTYTLTSDFYPSLTGPGIVDTTDAERVNKKLGVDEKSPVRVGLLKITPPKEEEGDGATAVSSQCFETDQDTYVVTTMPAVIDPTEEVGFPFTVLMGDGKCDLEPANALVEGTGMLYTKTTLQDYDPTENGNSWTRGGDLMGSVKPDDLFSVYYDKVREDPSSVQ